MKNITIRSAHKSVTEAVAASGIDFSYNPEAAAEDARDLDRGYRGAGRNILRPVTEAFVADVDGKVEILYTLECVESGGAIRFLNTFSPFVACLDDSPFTVLERNGTTFVERVSFPKTASARALLADLCTWASELYVA
ncbi:MAG: hypothetical protein EBR82_44180 [Caulobacteraceae bacterium]|nr:hypothetical protein [Caulobacteraceae bacterium]